MEYEIVIGGYVSDQRFEGFTAQRLPNRTTKLRGAFPDQAALYGMLREIHDLGMELISVSRKEETNDVGGGV